MLRLFTLLAIGLVCGTLGNASAHAGVFDFWKRKPPAATSVTSTERVRNAVVTSTPVSSSNAGDSRFRGSPLPRDQADLVFSLAKPTETDVIFYKWTTKSTPRAIQTPGEISEDLMRKLLADNQGRNGLYVAENPFASVGFADEKSELIEVHIPAGTPVLDLNDPETMRRLKGAGLDEKTILATHPKLIVTDTGHPSEPYWLIKDNRGIRIRRFDPSSYSTPLLQRLNAELGFSAMTSHLPNVAQVIDETKRVLAGRPDIDPKVSDLGSHAANRKAASPIFRAQIFGETVGADSISGQRELVFRFFVNAPNRVEVLRDLAAHWAEYENNPSFRKNFLALCQLYAKGSESQIGKIRPDFEVGEELGAILVRMILGRHPNDRASAMAILDNRYVGSRIRAPMNAPIPELVEQILAGGWDDAEARTVLEVLSTQQDRSSPGHAAGQAAYLKLAKQRPNTSLGELGVEKFLDIYSMDDGRLDRVMQGLADDSPFIHAHALEAITKCRISIHCEKDLIPYLPKVPIAQREEYVRAIADTRLLFTERRSRMGPATLPDLTVLRQWAGDEHSGLSPELRHRLQEAFQNPTAHSGPLYPLPPPVRTALRSTQDAAREGLAQLLPRHSDSADCPTRFKQQFKE